jgi:hypothetical protein
MIEALPVEFQQVREFFEKAGGLDRIKGSEGCVIPYQRRNSKCNDLR